MQKRSPEKVKLDLCLNNVVSAGYRSRSLPADFQSRPILKRIDRLKSSESAFKNLKKY